MAKFNFIIERIAQIQKELGLTNFIGFFEMLANDLPIILNQNKIAIDVYYSRFAEPVVRNEVLLLKNHITYQYNFINTISKSTCDYFPNVQASVALLLIDDDFINEDFITNIIKFKNEEYRIVYIKYYTNNTEVVSTVNNRWQSNVEIIPLAINDSEIHIQLETSLQTKDAIKLIDIAIIQTCIPLINSIKEILDLETKINFTQKQLVLQDNNIIRKNESSLSNNDITNTTKQIIQKNILDIEKGFKAKYDEINKPNIGEFYIKLEDFTNKLVFEDLDQIDVAEKSEKIETKLSDTKLNIFKESIVNNIHIEFKKDLMYLNSSTNDAIGKINNLLASKNLHKINQDNFIKPDIQPNKIITANNYIQRPYLGEITKKGIMEYFIALRDYTGMIMVVVGIIAPLTMLSSTQGEATGFWAFLNIISQNLKLIRQPIQFITIIVLVLMIIYGIFDLRIRIPKRRVEEQIRELKKARENLLQEGRRIYADISKDWTALLTNYLRDFAQNTSNEIDNILKTNVLEKQYKLSNKKNEIQLTQQSIDIKNRNILLAEKEYDILSKRVMEIKEKLNK